MATCSEDGRCDVSPRGGEPGFVTVLDDHHLAVPDATGNRRLDTLQNVVATAHAGLIFLIPGRNQTLRVNGRACVSSDPALLASLTPVGKPPRTAIVVRSDEVYTHCPKAFVRSKLWNPRTWLDEDAYPTGPEAAFAHGRHKEPGLTLVEVEKRQEESLKYRLL